jgi:hypothetical protein
MNLINDEIMKRDIERNIEIIKEKLELNKRIINENHQTLKNIIHQPGSSQRTEQFASHFRSNVELYSQNHRFIKLQFELVRALNPYEELKTFGAMSLS